MSTALDLGFIDEGARARARTARQRFRLSLGVSAGITALWLVYVTTAGHWGRVQEHVVAAITMIAGGFVAGSTPQGGGAVAFPVFTKALDVPAETARSFSLCIQAIGMSTAAATVA